MNKREKKAFVRNLCNDVRETILTRVGDMPEGWHGLHLREFIADAFNDERHMSHPAHKPRFKHALKDYERDKLRMK